MTIEVKTLSKDQELMHRLVMELSEFFDQRKVSPIARIFIMAADINVAMEALEMTMDDWAAFLVKGQYDDKH